MSPLRRTIRPRAVTRPGRTARRKWTSSSSVAWNSSGSRVASRAGPTVSCGDPGRRPRPRTRRRPARERLEDQQPARVWDAGAVAGVIEVVERGRLIAFTYDDMLQYHGPRSP